MKKRFPIHVYAAIALFVLILLLLARSIKPQAPIPVDLRPSPMSMEALSRPVDEGAAPALQYDILAFRYVLNDIRRRAQSLQNEAEYCYSDTHLLWSSWKSYFGLQGAFVEWGWFLRPSQAPEEQTFTTRLQSDLFRLESNAKRTQSEANDLAVRVAAAENQWIINRDLMLAAQARGESERASLGPLFVEFRSTLARLANRINALDEEIKSRQEDYDDVAPRLERYFQQHVQGSPLVTRPWHWQYILSDDPRASFQYDFEAQYKEQLARAHRKLDRLPAAPKRSIPATRP